MFLYCVTAIYLCVCIHATWLQNSPLCLVPPFYVSAKNIQGTPAHSPALLNAAPPHVYEPASTSVPNHVSLHIKNLSLPLDTFVFEIVPFTAYVANRATLVNSISTTSQLYSCPQYELEHSTHCQSGTNATQWHRQETLN